MQITLEWDEAKRQRTILERGLDFRDVKYIVWDEALTQEDARQSYPETRYITYAFINNRFCVVAWCYRGTNMRIISLRKANKREERKYGEN